MWEQRRNRQPMMHMITPGRAVAPGYMEWFYTNGKPFIMTPEARARVGGPSTSAVPGFAAQGPSTEPYTLMPPVFTHAYTPGSLFATGPSGSGHDVHDDVEVDRSEEDENDEDALVRRNLRRNRRAPDCGTGGHRRH
ncbi:hypothetical protein V6N13_082938 [Hibiscus sabdariffa]